MEKKKTKPGQVVWGDVRTGEFKVGRRSKHRTPVGRIIKWNRDGTAGVRLFAVVEMKDARIK